MYCNGPVDWHAGFLKIVPDSSHEAESAIGSRATKAVLFIRELLKYNNRKLYGPTAALGDNEALYKTVHHEGHSARVRHYERWAMLDSACGVLPEAARRTRRKGGTDK